jgi:hypothetical protein
VAKQLPFFIFPSNRCRRKKQNFLIKRAKKFQQGKWEELWKQSISEFEVEKKHIKPQQELSTAHKVRKAEYCHQHGEISRAAKVFTNNSKPTNDPAHSEPLQQLFPHPSEDYDSPTNMGEDSTQHWPSEIEINESWNTPQALERIIKYHSIPALTKYIRSRSLLSAPDIDGWRMKNLLQRIFLSSDPDNDDIKVLVYDCLYLPWLKGDFLPEFAPEYTGSYLIALQKPSGGIRGIAPVDIWRRATGNAIVQATQKRVAKTCIETYSNFKQLALSKDGASHCLYFLNAAYADPDFTSVEDAEDPMVFMQLDIKNAFGSLCARLVLDVLSGKASRDYSCGIKVDEAFETAVHELRAYFGFLSLLAHVNLFSVFTPTMGQRIT